MCYTKQFIEKMVSVNQLLFFCCVREIFAMFVRASSTRIFLAMNQSLLYGYYNNRNLDQGWDNAKCNGNGLQCITCLQSNAIYLLCNCFLEPFSELVCMDLEDSV